jgi:hypothetical protein
MSFYHDWEFDVSDSTDEVILLKPRTNGDRGYTQMRISDLYFDRDNAKRALVEAQMNYLRVEAKRLNVELVSKNGPVPIGG